MNKSVLHSLSEAEGQLVRDTEPEALRELDEDQLLDLHTRVRRARTKCVRVYRRGASRSVGSTGSRGSSYARNQRARDKAEIFEALLASVSKQVAVVARQASRELRDERLTAARAVRDGGPATRTSDDDPSNAPSTRRKATKTTGGLKRDASSRAKGGRRQAARDAR